MKEARAVANYIRVSPRKARLVVDLIRGLNVGDALSLLSISRTRAAHPLRKALVSAMANATAQEKAAPENLVVSAAFVDEGPTLKRFRPRAMGRATLIRKRTSRITIVLREQKVEEKEKEEARGAKEGKARKGVFKGRFKKRLKKSK